MKAVKIFLASSDELEFERLKLEQMIKKLNENIYNKKDIDIKMFTWETQDSQYRTVAKQEEYNEYVRQSDMFLGLFWTKAGKFTLEEFEVARKQYTQTQTTPALFIFFKEVEPEKEDDTLKKFKTHLLNDLAHYATNFVSVEKVQYEFLLEFLRLESIEELRSLKVDDKIVKYNDYEICDISALPFAANNEERLNLLKIIEQLKIDINELDSLSNEIKDLTSIQTSIKENRAKLECAEAELIQKDEALLRMSIDFASKINQDSSHSLREAHEAFIKGDMKRVRELTKLEDIDIRIKLKREIEKALENDYKLLLISRNAIMEDSSTPINERIEKAMCIREKIIELMNELHIDEFDRNNILSNGDWIVEISKLNNEIIQQPNNYKLYFIRGQLWEEYDYIVNALNDYHKADDLLKKYPPKDRQLFDFLLFRYFDCWDHLHHELIRRKNDWKS